MMFPEMCCYWWPLGASPIAFDDAEEEDPAMFSKFSKAMMTLVMLSKERL